MNRSYVLILLAAGAVFYLFNAAAGAMLPPEEGKERTRYGYWYRFVQRLAANEAQLASSRLLPAIAKELAAEARPLGGECGPWFERDERERFYPLNRRSFADKIKVPNTSQQETHSIMANKVETFFEKIGAWLKSHFTKTPALEVQVSSAVNYVVPFVEELDTLVAPEIAPVVNPILDKIKTGLAAVATTITDTTAAGKANVQSILASLQTNAAALESAFQVKDQATQAKVTGTIQLLNGEFSAIQAQLALASTSTTATPAPATT